MKHRQTARYLLFDPQMQLCGRQTAPEQKTVMVRPAEQVQPLAFSGIHVISLRLLSMMTDEGAFPIVPFYLRLAAQGAKILGFLADEYYWRDLGKPEDIRQVEQELNSSTAAPSHARDLVDQRDCLRATRRPDCS